MSNEEVKNPPSDLSAQIERSATDALNTSATLTFTADLEVIIKANSNKEDASAANSCLDTNSFCSLVAALHSFLYGFDSVVSSASASASGSTSSAAQCPSPATIQALQSLGPILDRHCVLLSDWEAAGCRPFEGLSARRKQDWPTVR